ncbi:MAG: protein kinase domain-containing protein, partial [Solirubrobacteraceae bacterium]
MQSIGRDTVIDGRYRVLDRLGSGGMADVYCAEDTQLGRRVALKLLYRRFAEDSEFVERFRREASSAAGLQHPNIVGIFDRGEWDGTYYIAMEFLDGQTLKQLVREHGAMPPELATDITFQVLRAARFAHKRGVVHRDIKPHNVILDGEGRAKVTDFGIARAGASDMTETGSIMGTAQYLSPEQAQGQPVSPRSDLYSIGVMLYELLTGRVPFDAESAVTIALKHVSERPRPPSELNPAVPPALDAVVLRALEKDPARRFADADEFAAALEAARAAPTVVAKEMRLEPYPMPGEPFAALEDEDRRSRRWWLWLLALLALAAVAVGAYLLLSPPQKPVPDVVGSRSAVASQRLQNAGFEVDIETVISDSVPKDRVATQR